MRKGETHTVPATGTPLGDLAVGSVLRLKENGSPVDYIIVNQGIPSNSSLYSSTCDGTWVLRKDIVATAKGADSNVSNSYVNSPTRAYLNNTFINLFDEETKSLIKTVKVSYVDGFSSTSGTLKTGEDGLSSQAFLLSGYEVGWTQANASALPIDGACLSYFIGTSETDKKRIAYLNGTSTFWWLRSPTMTHYAGVFAVDTTGGYASPFGGTYSHGVRPALILPSDAKLQDDGIWQVEKCQIFRKFPLLFFCLFLAFSVFHVEWGRKGPAVFLVSSFNLAKRLYLIQISNN
jgi:hypothetical protein